MGVILCACLMTLSSFEVVRSSCEGMCAPFVSVFLLRHVCMPGFGQSL